MVKMEIGDMILVGGIISQIRKEEERIYVSFHEETEDMVFEFRNGKKPRADHVKKLKLEQGERVIASGGKCKFSSAYVYGWDISREGKIGNKDYSLIRGCVRKIKMNKPGRSAVFVIDPQGLEIKVPSRLCDEIEVMDNISCLAYTYVRTECTSPCKNGITPKCIFCCKKAAKKRYIGIAVEKEEENAE